MPDALTPVYTEALFQPLCTELVTLLRRLDDDDWRRPTMAGPWRVRDVVAHLLDGDLRRLAIGRDAHRLPVATVSSFDELVGLIDGLNAGGVAYAERLSARLMTDLLEVTGGWVSAYVATLPPHGESIFPVAWADEDRSENWMDTGREYTERWHHQMQIREAVGAPGLFERRWFEPLMDLSVRAFRRAYRHLPADLGTCVVFEVEATPAQAWSVVREASAWRVMRGLADRAAATVRADPGTAWKLLFNALSPEEARAQVRISGDQALVGPMLAARSVMV